MIVTVLIASVLVYSWKIAGYLIPDRLLTEKVRAYAERVTVTLLAALVAIQTLTTDSQWTFDARIPAVMVAVGLLLLRAPFIVVVLAAAMTAAGLRLLGF